MSAPVLDAWRLEDVGDQGGRTVLVTGTTVGGLGHLTALELARAGARVVLAGRSADKLAATERAILGEVAAAELVTLQVDLSSLGSVRSAAARAADLGPIDVLVNNAGVAGPARARTVDGLDLLLTTNHFGPFLLTGLLLPQLVANGAGRVVTLSSTLSRLARDAPLGDPRHQPGRRARWSGYPRSKLANLLFTMQLDRRAREAGLPLRALAAHPGFTGTHLVANAVGARSAGGVATILDAAIRAVSQPARLGAWPSLMAATADLPGGTYCGPSGLGELSGAPQVVTAPALAYDESTGRRLWEISEEVTGTSWP